MRGMADGIVALEYSKIQDVKVHGRPDMHCVDAEYRLAGLACWLWRCLGS